MRRALWNSAVGDKRAIRRPVRRFNGTSGRSLGRSGRSGARSLVSARGKIHFIEYPSKMFHRAQMSRISRLGHRYLLAEVAEMQTAHQAALRFAQRCLVVLPVTLLVPRLLRFS